MSDLGRVSTALGQPVIGWRKIYCRTLYMTLHVRDGYISSVFPEQ